MTKTSGHHAPAAAATHARGAGKIQQRTRRIVRPIAKRLWTFDLQGFERLPAEGTRSRDGYLYKGHTGAARLALKVGCPIYPVGVIGTREIQPPDAKVPKLFKKATIKIGRPIKVDRYRNKVDDHLVLRQITDELMFEIRELTG